MILDFRTSGSAGANSVDPNQTAPEGAFLVSFCLNLFDALFYGKATLFNF